MRVCCCDYSCAQRYFLSLRAVRIARAVEAFLVMKDKWHQSLQLRGLLYYGLPQSRVLLDYAPFLFSEDGVGDANLTYVVEKSTDLDAPYLMSVYAQLSRCRYRNI